MTGQGDAVVPKAPERVHRPLLVTLAVLAAVVYVLDQVTKVLAVDRLEGRAPVVLVEGLLQLRLVRNPGAAFSIGTGFTVVLTAIAVVVVVVILRTARRLGSRAWAVALGLLLGGALGNLTDRFLRQPGPLRGHVVDFVEWPGFPVFNVADSAIVGGAVLVGLLGLRGIGVDGRREDDPAAEDTAAAPGGAGSGTARD